MKDLAIKAVATSPGGFYYREEHEWRGLDDKGAAWLTATMQKMDERIDKMARNPSDGHITAVFTAEVDGGPPSVLTATGITRREMSDYQQWFHKLGGELIQMGAERAAEKDKHHHGK